MGKSSYIYFRNAWTGSQLVERWKMMIWLIIIWLIISVSLATRAVVLGRTPGNSPVTMKVTPDYFHKKKNGRKVEPQQIPSCLIPSLLVVFTQKLENLVTVLDKQYQLILWMIRGAIKQTYYLGFSWQHSLLFNIINIYHYLFKRLVSHIFRIAACVERMLGLIE